jgi:hypothetical protein
MKRLISPLAAVAAVVMFAQPGFAQSPTYTWQLNCSKVPEFGVGTGVNWYWLHNGMQISSSETSPNGFSACATTLSGSDVIPESINGSEVNGIGVSLSLVNGCCGCEAFATLTKSFNPASPNISIKETVTGPARIRNKDYGIKINCSNPNASFEFDLQTQ